MNITKTCVSQYTPHIGTRLGQACRRDTLSRARAHACVERAAARDGTGPRSKTSDRGRRAVTRQCASERRVDFCERDLSLDKVSKKTRY